MEQILHKDGKKMITSNNYLKINNQNFIQQHKKLLVFMDLKIKL